MAATTTKLMTFAEFEQLPDTPQRQVRRLLENAAGDAGVVEKELGFRPLPDYEYRIAPNGHATTHRSRQVIPLFFDGYLPMGAIFAPVAG